MNPRVRPSDGYMDNITTRFEQCLRRHLRLVKPDSVNYAVELVHLGLDSMTAVALIREMEKMFDICFPDKVSLKIPSVTAGGLKKAVELLLQRKAS
jgi:acyl carrier protein